MKQKSWHLDRRTLLKSMGVSMPLPWLECMRFGDVRVAMCARRAARGNREADGSVAGLGVVVVGTVAKLLTSVGSAVR